MITDSTHRILPQWLSAAAYSGMFGFGMTMALLGAVLPFLSQRLHFDLAHAGNLFLLMNAAMLVTTLTLGPVLDRFGLKGALIISPLFLAAALGLIARVNTFNELAGAIVLLGIGGGALNQTTNTLVADLHEDERSKSAALNLLGVFFGFGAVFLPFTIGSLIETLGLANILRLGIIPSLLPAVLSVVLAFPPPRHDADVPFREIVDLAREPLVCTFSFLLFFESGNEFILGGYATTYLTRDLAASARMASYLLALYWGALMAARVVLSRLLLRVGGATLVLASAAGVAISVALLIAARSLALATVSMALLGFSIAAIFPTVLGLAGARYARHSGTVFGIMIAIALSGGMTLPWIVGRVAEARGLRSGLLISIFNALAIFILQWTAVRIMRKQDA